MIILLINKVVKDSKEYLGESIPPLQLCISKTLDNTNLKNILNKCANIMSYFNLSTVAANV